MHGSGAWGFPQASHMQSQPTHMYDHPHPNHHINGKHTIAAESIATSSIATSCHNFLHSIPSYVLKSLMIFVNRSLTLPISCKQKVKTSAKGPLGSVPQFLLLIATGGGNNTSWARSIKKRSGCTYLVVFKPYFVSYGFPVFSFNVSGSLLHETRSAWHNV